MPKFLDFLLEVFCENQLYSKEYSYFWENQFDKLNIWYYYSIVILEIYAASTAPMNCENRGACG